MKYLSTVRSTHRGELMTETPSRVRRWRASSRKMTCSSDPAGIARTITAPQSSSRTPPAASASPLAPMATAAARPVMGATAGSTPRSRSARPSRTSCQPDREPRMATFTPRLQRCRRSPRATAERSPEHLGVEAAGTEDASGGQVVDDDLRRAEEHPVDLVELVAGALEDLVERGAVVRRCRGRQALDHRGDLGVVGVDGEVGAGAIENAVVRPPDGAKVVLRHRGERDTGPRRSARFGRRTRAPASCGARSRPSARRPGRTRRCWRSGR